MKTQNSLKYKLLRMLICATVIPTLMIGSAAYWFSSTFLIDSAIASTEQMNVHKADIFDSFAGELGTILKDLTDSEATKAFLQLRDEKESESYYLSIVRLSEKMDTLTTQRGDAVNAVAFLWNDGTLPMMRSNGYSMPLYGDYRGNFFYQAMVQSDAAVHWIVLEEQQNGQKGLFLYKTIYDAGTDQNLGVAVIHIDEDYIRSILQTGNQVSDYTMLMTDTGELTFYAGTLFHNNIAFAGQITQFANEVKEGSKTILLEKEPYLMSVAKSEKTGYRLVNITSLDVIKESTRRIVISIFIALFAALLLAVFFSLLLFHYFKQPIIGLHTAMSRFREGNLDERVDVKRKDELGQLGASFNEMAERINRQIIEIEEEQKEKKEIAMRFLQAQISPHFLYNTLNSIKVLTRMRRNEEACEMTTSLISLLRIASGGEEEITLIQEVQYVEHYCLLMRKRRDAVIELHTEIPDELEACKVLKFTLQPFVENSIIHNETEKPIQISISAKILPENVLELLVQDDGSGFDTHILRKAQSQNEKQRFNRIGIHNVAERIRLYYGEDFDVFIQSEPNCGTCVVITLPLSFDTK